MRIYLASLISVLLYACNPSASQEDNASREAPENLSTEEIQRDSLYDAMMAVHDDVMPEMDRMYWLRRRATAIADSLQNEPDIPIPADTLQAIAQQVELAEEAMMNWMRSNDFQFGDMSHEEIMQKLEEEKEKITFVRKQMLSSIQEAEEALAQFDEE
jgi:hypothetical protein